MIKTDELSVIRAILRERGAATKQELLDALGVGVGKDSTTAVTAQSVDDRLEETMDYLAGIGLAQVSGRDRWIGLDNQGRPIRPPKTITIRASCSFQEVQADGAGRLELRKIPKDVPAPKPTPRVTRVVSQTAYTEDLGIAIAALLGTGATMKAAAEANGVTEWQVRHWQARHPSFRARCLEANGGKRGPKSPPPTEAELQTMREMVAAGKTPYRIGLVLHRDRKVVERWIAKYGQVK